VFEQEIKQFPRVREEEEKKKGDEQAVEKTRILEITTLSLDYSPQCCPPTPPKTASVNFFAFQPIDLSEGN
jgi:hypothetical protein